MFKIAGLAFAVVMGFFMSMTMTFFLSLIAADFSMSFLPHWLHVWKYAYPIAVISIIFYRPLALFITGRFVLWWQSRHQKNV